MAAKLRFTSQKRVALPGSERKPIAEAGELPTAPAPKLSKGSMMVSVVVRRKQPIATKALGKAAGRLSRAEFAKRHGPDPSSVRMVKTFAAEFGLTSEMATGLGRRTVHVTGTQAAMQKAFGVKFKTHEKYRVREGEICLPEELSGHVEAVLGLDNRPQAKPHNRAASAKATNISYTPVQVAQLYGFPAGATATGQTIGIIELGGGFRTADLTAYFKTLGPDRADGDGGVGRQGQELARQGQWRRWRGKCSISRFARPSLRVQRSPFTSRRIRIKALSTRLRPRFTIRPTSECDLDQLGRP